MRPVLLIDLSKSPELKRLHEKHQEERRRRREGKRLQIRRMIREEICFGPVSTLTGRLEARILELID